MQTIAAWAGPEKRQHERVSVSLNAVLLMYRKRLDVRLVDISRGGAALRVRGEPPMRGDEVVLELERAQVVSTVAWVKDDCCGLAFHRALDLWQMPRETGA